MRAKARSYNVQLVLYFFLLLKSKDEFISNNFFSEYVAFATFIVVLMISTLHLT